MDKSLRNLIYRVGLLGFFVAAVIIAFLINSEAKAPLLIDISPFLVMLLVGFLSVKLALKQPQFFQQSITFGKMAQIGTLSGLVAVSPFLLYGAVKFFDNSPGGWGPAIARDIFVASLSGVLLSAIGGGLAKLWTTKPRYSPSAQEIERKKEV